MRNCNITWYSSQAEPSTVILLLQQHRTGQTIEECNSKTYNKTFFLFFRSCSITFDVFNNFVSWCTLMKQMSAKNCLTFIKMVHNDIPWVIYWIIL
jgi:hypothetical protein